MLVAEDVHQIRSGYHGIYTAVYLITGEYLCLIDSGETETWDERIIPYIRSIGREPTEVERIIHTHGHDDHIHIRAPEAIYALSLVADSDHPCRPELRQDGPLQLIGVLELVDEKQRSRTTTRRLPFPAAPLKKSPGPEL